jgi:hypothetical protein
MKPTTAILILCSILAGCKADGPDPNLFPIADKSPEYKAGFTDGFAEGLNWGEAIHHEKHQQ